MNTALSVGKVCCWFRLVCGYVSFRHFNFFFAKIVSLVVCIRLRPLVFNLRVFSHILFICSFSAQQNYNTELQFIIISINIFINNIICCIETEIQNKYF